MSDIDPSTTGPSPAAQPEGNSTSGGLRSLWRRASDRLRQSWAGVSSPESKWRRRAWTIMGLSVLVCLVYASLVFRYGAQWWLGFAALAAATILIVFWLVTDFFPKHREPRDWVIERSVSFITLLTMLALVVGFFLWLVVNFFWSAGDPLMSSDDTRFTDVASDTTVFVAASYPSVALAEAADNQLHLTFTNPDGGDLPAMSLQMVIKPGESLALAEAPGLEEETYRIELGPFKPTTKFISVINGHSYQGIRRDQHITITLLDAQGQNLGNVIEVPVTVEGQRGFALRRFVTDTINEKSPYIFFLLLVAPGLAALAQRTIDKRYEELQARRRKEHEGLVNDFREQLRLFDVKTATSTLEKLRQSQYKEFDGGISENGQRLIDLAELHPAKLEVAKKAPEVAKTLPDEFVAVWILAWNAAQRSPETGKLLDEKIKELLDKGRDAALNAISDGLSQDKGVRDSFLAAVAVDYGRKEREEASQRKLASSNSLIVPFKCDSAQDKDESQFLYEAEGFWGGHPLYKGHLLRLDPDKSYVIHSEEGCGRTAFAQVYYGQSKKLRPSSAALAVPLVVELVDERDMTQVCAAVINRLFDELQYDPESLERLNTNQKDLLADLLLAHVGYHRMLYQLEEAQKGQSVDIKQDYRRSLFLEKFKRVLQSRAEKPSRRLTDLRPEKWETPNGAYRIIANTVFSLGYSNVTLIYDSETSDYSWLQRLILQPLDQWHASRTHFVVFMPSELYRELETALPVNINEHHLTWTRDELESMALWRYEHFLRAANAPEAEIGAPSAHFYERFEEERQGLERLLDAARAPAAASYNPRLFIQLWQRIVQYEPNRYLTYQDTITKVNLDRVLSTPEAGVSDHG